MAHNSTNDTFPLNSAQRRTSSLASIRTAGSTRVGQLARDTLNAEPPLGAWRAIAQETSQAPTIGEIRRSSYTGDGWLSDPRSRSSSNASGRRKSGRSPSSGTLIGATLAESAEKRDEFPTLTEEATHTSVPQNDGAREQVQGEPKSANAKTTPDSLSLSNSITKATSERPMLSADQRVQRVHSSGYIPPAKLPWKTSWAIGLKAFWKWFITPAGFLITIYALNVVAWGGMLFLLLCGAAPEMCWAKDSIRGWVRDCNHIDSSRRIWLETDSQILNALFCVTGFGLIPWRFRDLYYLLRWRLCNEQKYGTQQKYYGLRTLAALNKDWLRLPGTDTLDQLSTSEYLAQNNIRIIPSPRATPEAMSDASFDPRLPYSLAKTPPPPLTGVRAPPTALWKLDFFIWCMVWNTFIQGALSGIMWGMNRYDRPSWTTGFLIAIACIIAGVGGFVTFLEGKKVKRVEGVAASEAVERELRRLGVRELEDGRVGSVTETEQVVWSGKERA